MEGIKCPSCCLYASEGEGMGWPTLKADVTDSHCVGVGVTPGFKAKLNAHSMCV
jgi:hypothetical protein